MGHFHIDHHVSTRELEKEGILLAGEGRQEAENDA